MNEHPILPYFQTTRIRVRAMAELAAVQQGERAADLGTGDGRIAIALAQAGATVTAFEMDETRAALALAKVQAAALDDRVTIVLRDFWQEDLSDFDIVAVYPMPDIMADLEAKLQAELKPGARVLCNYFPFPNWQERAIREHVYFYRRT